MTMVAGAASQFSAPLQPGRVDWLARVEFLYALFAVMFMTGGLTRLLSGGLPEDVARTVSSPLVQISGAGIYVLAVALLALRLRAFLPVALRCAVVFAPVLLALASTAWSVDPDVTLRRSISLMGTTLVGLYLGMRFDLATIGRILFLALSAIVFGSFAVAVAAPGFGVHQTSDPLTSHHAGLWRGLYWHKNNLGPVASILTLITIALWRLISYPAFVKMAMLVIAAIVVLRSGSSQALFQFVLFTALLLGHRSFSRMPGTARLALVTMALAPLMVATLYASEIQAVVLELLGRDATLSSRIFIWHAAVLGGMQHAMLGAGYDVGWFGGADLLAQQLYYTIVGHAHNGYLQLWLDLGWVGVTLLAIVWIIFLVRTIQVSRRDLTCYILCLYFLIFYLVSNYITTFLLQYQSIYWIMLTLLLARSTALIHDGAQKRSTRAMTTT